MPRIEAVLIAAHEKRLGQSGDRIHYRTSWLTLEVGETRDDGRTPATRTGMIEATFGQIARLEVVELLASLESERVTYELS